MNLLQSVIAQISPSGAVLRAEQLLDAACLSLLSDENATDDEIDWLVPVLSEHPAFATKDAGEIRALVDAAFDRAMTHDDVESATDALADTLKNSAEREEAFAVVAAVQHADGRIEPGENEFLIDLAGVLGLDEDRANEILAVTDRLAAE